MDPFKKPGSIWGGEGMITLENVAVSIGQKEIISSTTGQALAGKMTVVIGPNGSGKSTLLKAISGDLKYQGLITFDGEHVHQIPAWKLAMRRAVLAQSSHVSFPFNVGDIVAMGLMAGGRLAQNSNKFESVSKALARVGLSGFEKRLYQDLSGGEQQRVHMARLLCQIGDPVIDGNANFLFLDEPIASLDIQHQLNLLTLAKDFCQRGGGVIIILHDLNLTSLFADHIWLMCQGKLSVSGQKQEVLRDDILADVYQCPLKVGYIPEKETHFILPQSAYYV